MLPPGCGVVRAMILRQANLKDTVTQREDLQYQRGQRLAPSATLDRSHSPILTGTGSIWVKKAGLKTHRGLSQQWRDPEPSGGAEEKGWDEVGRDGITPRIPSSAGRKSRSCKLILNVREQRSAERDRTGSTAGSSNSGESFATIQGIIIKITNSN